MPKFILPVCIEIDPPKTAGGKIYTVTATCTCGYRFAIPVWDPNIIIILEDPEYLSDYFGRNILTRCKGVHHE